MPTGSAFIPTGTAPPVAPPQGKLADALSALVNLGYRRAEAEAALSAVQAEAGEDAALDELIRGGLRRLAR
jgi:Holliday junction DNA helicase RuvA